MWKALVRADPEADSTLTPASRHIAPALAHFAVHDSRLCSWGHSEIQRCINTDVLTMSTMANHLLLVVLRRRIQKTRWTAKLVADPAVSTQRLVYRIQHGAVHEQLVTTIFAHSRCQSSSGQR
jgi:hypothetical protein